MWWLIDRGVFLSRVRRWLRLIVKSSHQRSLNCSVTDTKEAKQWHAKCLISYVTGCLYCRVTIYKHVIFPSLFLTDGKRKPTTWTIFPVVIQALSGTSYMIIYLSRIPLWISALPSEESQEKGAEIISRETNYFLHKAVNNSMLEADIVHDNLWCFKCSQLKTTRSKYLNNYKFLNKAFQNTGIMQHSNYILYSIFPLFCVPLF